MPNDPAFLFYPGDYLRDTQMLSEKTQVAYDRIMCEHMRNICISQKQHKFLTKRLNEDELDELNMVIVKVNGGYQIPWVAESISKRKAYSESRRKNREGSNKENPSNISKSYESHMENENEDVNVIKKEKENKNCLMKNSNVSVKLVAEAFLKSDDLRHANPKHYFNTVMDWSNSNGKMRKDWLAAVRNWARSDLKDGKMQIVKKERTEIEAAPEDFGIVSATATQMPEGMSDRLKKSTENIGQ